MTRAFSTPLSTGFFKGLGVSYSLGALHKLDRGAIVQKITAIHVNIGHLGVPSISTQVAALRKLLLGRIPEDDDVQDPETANVLLQVAHVRCLLFIPFLRQPQEWGIVGRYSGCGAHTFRRYYRNSDLA